MARSASPAWWLASLMVAVASGLAAWAEPSDRPLGILLAAGDIAQCGADKFQQLATANLLGREIAAAKAAVIPVMILALGDLAYPRGTEEEFKCFHDSWGKYMELLLPVPGNHEYGASRDAAAYFSYFEGGGKSIVSKNGPRSGYYSLNFPDSGTDQWHIIGLNSAVNGPAHDQLSWLKVDLDADDRRCVLAFAHYFRFSSGRHGHEPPSYGPRTKRRNQKKNTLPDDRMKEAFRTLQASGASVMISGHDHHYEAFEPQDADGNAVANGLRSFIAGTGGAPFYSETYRSHWPNSDTAKYQAKWHGVLKLELFAAEYRWRFVPAGDARDVPVALTSPVTSACNSRQKAP
jgi:acid phosphatase type 7